jgi:hypothetical protein
MRPNYTPDELRAQINKMWLRQYADGPTNQEWILNVGIGAGMLSVAADRIAELEEALLSLLPGLELDLRYADADDDLDAFRSRIATVRDCFKSETADSKHPQPEVHEAWVAALAKETPAEPKLCDCIVLCRESNSAWKCPPGDVCKLTTQSDRGGVAK